MNILQKTGLMLSLLSVLSLNASEKQAESTSNSSLRVQSHFDRSSLAAGRISSDAVIASIKQWNEFCNEKEIPSKNSMHGFMLIRDGKVVSEGFWRPFRPEIPHMLFSGTKSFIATAIGFAIQENLLTMDTKLVDLFPDELPEKVSENLAMLNIRDLLTMRTGYLAESSKIMFDAANPAKGFLSIDFAVKPGTKFHYDSGVSNMLSLVITKITGQSVEAYLKPRLFEPLGFGSYYWDNDKFGNSLGGWGLSVTLEDFAKLGQLYLDKGKWNDKQILNSQWCESATSRQTELVTDKISYGYHFWVGPEKVFHMSGMFGQFVWIFPEEKFIVATLGGNLFGPMIPKDPIWEILLPSIHGSLTIKNQGAENLADILENLSFIRSSDASQTVKFTNDTEIELQIENEKAEEKETCKIRFSDKIILSLPDGFSQEFTRGKWHKGQIPPSNSNKISNLEVWTRAYWPQADTLILDEVELNGPGQVIRTFKFEDSGEVNCETIYWHSEPIKSSGKWKLSSGVNVSGTSVSDK